MKRMIVCALALVLSFSLFGCGSKPAENSASPTVALQEEEFVDETLNEISYQVPKAWERADAADGYYYYPSSESGNIAI